VILSPVPQATVGISGHIGGYTADVHKLPLGSVIIPTVDVKTGFIVGIISPVDGDVACAAVVGIYLSPVRVCYQYRACYVEGTG